MGDKAAENAAQDGVEEQISEKKAGTDQRAAGNSSFKTTRISSSSFDANSMKHNPGNTGERLYQGSRAQSVTTAGASRNSRPVHSTSGMRRKSAIEAVGHGSSLHNTSLYSPDSSNQVRSDNEASYLANFSEGTNSIQTSTVGGSHPCQQQPFSKENIEQPSFHLFTEPNTCPPHNTQQLSIKTTTSQSYHQSAHTKKMGNLCTASMSQHRQQPGLQSSVSENKQQLPQFQYDVSTSLQRRLEPMKLPQNLGRAFLPEGTQAQQHKSTFLQTQSSTVGDQRKQIEQSYRMLPENSSALISQTNSSIWYDQAYQQVLRLRESYLADVIKDYQRAQDMCTQPSNPEKKANRERKRIFLNKVMAFLHMAKAEFVQFSKERVENHMGLILKYLDQLRARHASPTQHHQHLQQSSSQFAISQMQQRGEENPQAIIPRQDMTSTLVGAPQLSTLKGLLNSQARPTNSFQEGSLAGRETTEPSSVNLLKYDPVRSPQQSGSSRPQEANMNISPHVGSESKLERRASSSFPPGPALNIYHNAMKDPHQVNSSARVISNKLSIISSLPSNPTPSVSQIIVQQEKYQMMQAQKMQQPMQLAVTCENESTMLVQKESEINNSTLGQVMGYQRIPQQHHLIGQHLEHYAHRWGPSSTSQHHFESSRASQLPSSLAGLKDLSWKDKQTHPVDYLATSPTTQEQDSLKSQGQKASTEPQPAASLESSKDNNIQCSPGKFHFTAIGRNQLLNLDSHAQPRPSLNDGTTLLESSEQSHAPGEGFRRLIKAVKSLSPEASTAATQDIGAVIHLTDRTAGSSHYGESREYIGNDLVYGMRANAHEWEFISFSGAASEKRMNLGLGSMALDGLTSPSCVSDHQNSTIKRLKTKHSDCLLQEITDINQKLIETVVDMNHDGKDARAGTDNGTTVRFSYTPVGLARNANLQHGTSSMLTNLLLQVLVTADYPYSSPLVLDAFPEKFRENEEIKALWENAFSKFSSSLRKCSQPIPLGKMAMIWDVSARDAFREFAEKLGGGSFSSKYGEWENCVSK